MALLNPCAHLFEKRDRKILSSDSFYQPDAKLVTAQSTRDTANHASHETVYQRLAGGVEGPEREALRILVDRADQPYAVFRDV